MLDSAFQALADPTRRAVIERLCDGPASVSELAKPFDMTLAAVVQHVQVLEAAGLVQTSKVGRVRTVQIDPAGLRAAEEWLAARRTLVEQQLDRLADLLAEPSISKKE
jgi:DNA-binding transcriptional ArsR family regulator